MERRANSGKERRSAASSIKLCLMCGGAGSGGEPDKAGATCTVLSVYFSDWQGPRGTSQVYGYCILV